MNLDELNLRKFVMTKYFKETLEKKYFNNNKLIDALEEFIYYSNNKKINKEFKIDIIKIEKQNSYIEKLLDDLIT